MDDSLQFYGALGFEVTYRQKRPNPYAVVAREEIQIHLAGIDRFDPSQSYGSVIIAVPGVDTLYSDIADRLRVAYGKLPSAGIPRILRLRRKQGTARGFSIVDPGGNWLRFYRLGDSEENEPTVTGLEHVIDNAARRADAQGDDEAGRRLVANGLRRYVDAPADTRFRALAYLVELDVRLGRLDLATVSLAEALEIAPIIDEETRSTLCHAQHLLD